MTDLDPLSARLDALSQTAPTSTVDPIEDVLRGRKALRRRRVRGAAGVATALVAVGVVATAVNLPGSPGSPNGISPVSTASPHIEAAANSISSLCLEEYNRTAELNGAPESRPILPAPRTEPRRPQWEHPAVAPQLAAYRQAAASILDPSGRHLDADVNGVQFGCNMANSQLTSLGTKLGWTSSGAPGMVQLEVVSSEHEEKPQIVINHDRWTAAEENLLPAGVTKAWVTTYQDGQAVYVERQDGLTIAVDATGIWGNNVAPGSSLAQDLPAIEKLLKLAASKSLVLPED